MADSPSLQAQDEIIADWVSAMIANRLIVTDVPDTVLKLARIKGIKSIAITDVGEADIQRRMEDELRTFAQRQLAAGQVLPRFTAPPPEVADEVSRCVVHSRVKQLLKSRCAAWGAQRENLPPGIMAAFLADFDQLITRHAAQMRSAA